MSTILNVSTFQFLNIVVTSVQNQHATLPEFYEHFKYDVISSSLLSSSITAPSSTRRRSSPSPDDPPSDDPEPESHDRASPTVTCPTRDLSQPCIVAPPFMLMPDIPLPRLFHALRSNRDHFILLWIIHYHVWTSSRFNPTCRRFFILSDLVLK